MSIWAIAYDLDVKGMKAAGYTKSNVTQFYISVRKTLQDNHFEKLKQWSIYTSSQENSLTDAFGVALALKSVVDADKFVKRLHLFRIEDFNDLLPLIVPGKTSDDGDAIEQEIDEVFPEVAAVAS
jgi:virulence-associated protein VapD